MKHIAHLVGYATTSKLDRQFQRCCHIAPTAFRRASVSTAVYPSIDARRVLHYLGERPSASPAEVADSLGVDFGVILMVEPSFAQVDMNRA